MNLVEGPHCTIVDPRLDGDARTIRAKARSLVTRFEKLGRSRDTLMVAVSFLCTRVTRPKHHLTSRPRARKNTNCETKKKNENQIPATEAGIEATARLRREDGINVNLTFVSGVMHAAACAQAGAAVVTLPIAKVCLFVFFLFLLDFTLGNWNC